ncbi:MAG TPA: phosphotransferase [Acidimicrobiia bacterium]|nr:phosphotransferase [Acidimicrobiia bacterium]
MDDADRTEEALLAGGVANAGRVVRVGRHVLRPSNEHSETILSFLSSLRAAGFEGASMPIGIDADGRERLEFVEGDVPVPPYPEWVQSDVALASMAALLARFHEASRSFDPRGLNWPTEMADPVGGPIVCDNDVCLENVVFRNGEPVALLDFDFAAPGRPVYDVAQFARLCVPIDDDVNAVRLGWGQVDKPDRLHLVADTYGLDASARGELLAVLDDSIARGGEFVRRRVALGDPGFVAMWAEMGGMERFDRRRRWWTDSRDLLARAMR